MEAYDTFSNFLVMYYDMHQFARSHLVNYPSLTFLLVILCFSLFSSCTFFFLVNFNEDCFHSLFVFYLFTLLLASFMLDMAESLIGNVRCNYYEKFHDLVRNATLGSIWGRSMVSSGIG